MEREVTACGTTRPRADLARSRARLGSGLFNERSDDIRPRHIDCVAARGLLDGRTRPLGHRALGRRGDHPIFSRDKVPAWLAPPCRLADRTAQGFNTPRDL